MEDKSHKTKDQILIITENHLTSWQYLQCYKSTHKSVTWFPKKIFQWQNWRNSEYFAEKWKKILDFQILSMSVCLIFLTGWFWVLQKKIWQRSQAVLWQRFLADFKLATYTAIQGKQIVWWDHRQQLLLDSTILPYMLPEVVFFQWQLESSIVTGEVEVKESYDRCN